MLKVSIFFSGFDGFFSSVLEEVNYIAADSPVFVLLFFFSGSSRIVNFDKEENGNNNIEDSNYDGCYHQPEKKRRLTTDQVQFLERSFEVENKLEPERKAQLAKELGLQPRQVAIWFQNRRARYKTKQLEKEYNCLKASYDKLNADYDCLFKENQKLKNEVIFILFFQIKKKKQKNWIKLTDSLT